MPINYVKMNAKKLQVLREVMRIPCTEKNQIEGHKGVNTIQVGTKDKVCTFALEDYSECLAFEHCNENNKFKQLRNDNQNEGEKMINWKRRTRLVCVSNNLKKDTTLKIMEIVVIMLL